MSENTEILKEILQELKEIKVNLVEANETLDNIYLDNDTLNNRENVLSANTLIDLDDLNDDNFLESF